jgi:hypothetical protein
MPINIDYSPVGALVSAAQGAGQAEAQRTSFSQGLQLADLGLRQQAQNQAFSLQKAYAERQAAEQSRTPAADHIAERLNLETANRQAERTVIKTHLDGMLSKGQISDDQYQQAMAGVLSDSKELTAQAILQGNRPDPMQKPQFSARVQMLRDDRVTLQNELRQIHVARSNVLTPADALSEGKVREAAIRKELAANVAEEMGMLTGPEKAASPAGTLSFNGKVVSTTAAPGSLSIRPAGQVAPAMIPGLPDPSKFEEGHILRNKTTGQTMILQQGAWVPQSAPIPQKLSPPGGITPAWQAAHPSSPQTDNPYLDLQGNALVY